MIIFLMGSEMNKKDNYYNNIYSAVHCINLFCRQSTFIAI